MFIKVPVNWFGQILEVGTHRAADLQSDPFKSGLTDWCRANQGGPDWLMQGEARPDSISIGSIDGGNGLARLFLGVDTWHAVDFHAPTPLLHWTIIQRVFQISIFAPPPCFVPPFRVFVFCNLISCLYGLTWIDWSRRVRQQDMVLEIWISQGVSSMYFSNLGWSYLRVLWMPLRFANKDPWLYCYVLMHGCIFRNLCWMLRAFVFLNEKSFHAPINSANWLQNLC